METLTPELQSYLLEFLPLKYRLIMARMNRSWYFASLSRPLQRRTLFVYIEPSKTRCSVSKKYSRRYDTFMNTMMKSQRQFIELKLQKLNYNHLRDATIIENLGDRITSLYLVNLCHFSGTFMNAISRCCKNLQKLEIESIRKFSDCNQKFQQMPSLKTIHFVKNRMCDKWFNLITQCAPNLKELSLNACRIATEHYVIEKYYPYYLNQISENVTDYNSKLVLTYVNIINYLKSAKNIKVLNIDGCVHIFSQLPQHIKLNTLRGYSLDPFNLANLKMDIFGRTLNAHLSLKTLELTYVNITCLNHLSQLCNLNHLHITYWKTRDSLLMNSEEFWNHHLRYIDSFYNALKQMKYLKTLQAREIIFNNFDPLRFQPRIPEETLISIKNLDVTIDNSFPILSLNINLKSLRLANCYYFEFFHYTSLFKRVLNLNSLELHGCHKLCDDVLMAAPISNIKGLEYLYLTHTKLTHLSLRFIRLFHLQHLHICLSLEPNIQLQSDLSYFETSLKCLSINNPNLEYIHIDLNRRDKLHIQSNKALHKAALNTKKFKGYFKNLVEFRMPLEIRENE